MRLLGRCFLDWGPMAISTPKWGYSPALDQLRFLAATLVLFHHFKPFSEISKGASGLRYMGDLWLQHGGVGVSLFIVLTGFLFSMIFDAGRLPVHYGRFIAKRALRIVPMYLIVMFLLMTQIRETWTAGAFLNFALFQVNAGDHMSGFGNDFLPIGSIWTIGVEFQFYLMFPLLIAAVPAYDWRRICGVCSRSCCSGSCSAPGRSDPPPITTSTTPCSAVSTSS
ncbi:hypothetical protein CCR94_16810 [Rhodoblastus sphagnicola]|uniref:Acyltransferase 3 domain-containing protein n=2 Tax=Rhodoblastus sphagnicola TaxID=333368 RepID=A0A2S6N2I9_9HYPH|nr:hypothetical protein CCR94_16810 [Rhodoblastus sphagnicola]